MQGDQVQTSAADQQKLNEKKPKNMNEILFKFQDIVTGQDKDQAQSQGTFNLQDIFQSQILSQGLHRIVQPPALRLTPRDIYSEIRQIASKRFGYELPAEQRKLSSLSSINNKTALLRDLCKVVGIKIKYDPEREFLLGNKTKQIVTYHNDRLQKQQSAQNQQKKKKGNQM